MALARELQVPPLQLLDVDADDPPLEALRLAVGLTLQELAEVSGVPFSTYRRLEVGAVRGAPSRQTVETLAAALQVSSERIAAALARSATPTSH